MAMDVMIGALLALATGLFASVLRLDRDRAFYPTVLVVVASYYLLFAVMAQAAGAIVPEVLVLLGFACLAAVGFRSSLWLVVAGLAGHGLFDALRGGLIANPGTPAWWPMFCLSYDVAAAGYLALLLSLRGRRQRSASSPGEVRPSEDYPQPIPSPSAAPRAGVIVRARRGG